VAFTHHHIGIHERRPTGDVEASSRQPAELAPLDDISGLPEIEQVRNLGMAYYGMSQRAGDPQSARYFQLRARQLLASVRKAGMHDSEVTAALSRLYLMDRAAEEGVRLAREALRSEDLDSKARVNSLFAVALHGFETRQWSSAQIALDELVSLRRLAGDWDLRGVCRSQTGDLQGALSDLQQAAAINPFLPGIRLNLAAVYEQRGDASSAERERSIAAALSRRQSGR
jgi:tetratricopeptide (TPR) repeat protein